MRLGDVANQLKVLLPAYTDLFSTKIPFTSITSDGATVTVTTTSSHNLATGQSVTFNGVAFKNQLATTTLINANTVEFTTLVDNDVSTNWFRNPSERDTVNEVQLVGFTGGDTVWNSIRTLVAVPNRKTFQVASNGDTLPTLTTAEFLLEIVSGFINGAQTVTVTGASTFTFSNTAPAGVYVGGDLSEMPRVAVATDPDDAWNRVLTREDPNKFSLAIIPVDPTTSKARNEQTDAVASQASGNDLRLLILDGFELLIKVPVNTQLAAGTAIDICRHDLRSVFYSCLFGLKLDTGMRAGTDFKLTPITDGVREYNRGVFIYSYVWQFPFEVSLDDSVPPDAQRAFRNVDITENISDGVSTPDLDLDDEPLTP